LAIWSTEERNEGNLAWTHWEFNLALNLSLFTEMIHVAHIFWTWNNSWLTVSSCLLQFDQFSFQIFDLRSNFESLLQFSFGLGQSSLSFVKSLILIWVRLLLVLRLIDNHGLSLRPILWSSWGSSWGRLLVDSNWGNFLWLWVINNFVSVVPRWSHWRLLWSLLLVLWSSIVNWLSIWCWLLSNVVWLLVIRAWVLLRLWCLKTSGVHALCYFLWSHWHVIILWLTLISWVKHTWLVILDGRSGVWICVLVGVFVVTHVVKIFKIIEHCKILAL